MLRITDQNRPWWILVGACMGLLILMMDSTVVNLALPSIQHDLNASTPALQWVLNGYLLVIAVLVVTLGRLGDMFGRKRVFLMGMWVFLAGSVLAALAQSDVVLIAARVVQGVGAASMLTLSLAIVSGAFPDEQRAKALGIWAGVSAVGLGLGPLVGGALIDAVSWRWIFWINLPFLAAGIAIIMAAAPETRDEEGGREIDVPGVLAFSAGLTAIVLALVEAREWGWTSGRTLGLLIGGAAALGAFVFIEGRVKHPIVEFALFRNRRFLGASVAAFAALAGYWALMFLQPQYLQNVLDHSPLVSGILILPITAPLIFISPLAGRLIARFGAGRLMTFGMLLALAGLVVLTQIGPHTGYELLFPAFLLYGVSLGLIYAPMSVAAMEALPKAKAGVAAGVLAMERVMGGVLGIAVVGAVFQTLEQDRLRDLVAARGARLDTSDRIEINGLLSGSDAAVRSLARFPANVAAVIKDVADDAFAFALANSTWVLVGITAVATIGTALLLRAPHPPPADPSAAQPHEPHHPLRHWFHL